MGDGLDLGVDTSMTDVTSTAADTGSTDASSSATTDSGWGSSIMSLVGTATGVYQQVTGKQLFTAPAQNPQPVGPAGNAPAVEPGFFRRLALKWSMPLWAVVVVTAVLPGALLVFILWRLFRRKG